MGLFDNDIYICGLIIAIITLILIYVNNNRQKKALTPDIKIIHRSDTRPSRTFPRYLKFRLKNMGLGRAKNIEVTYDSEIGDFQVEEHEEELFPEKELLITLDWREEELNAPNIGVVTVTVRYESDLKYFLIFKWRKSHVVEFKKRGFIVLITKDGN